jgi:tripartite-type tricarboxylate transporter receptor subunit TctC
VNPATGFKTVADYIQAAKARPGRVSFASSGSGSTPHLAFELLKSQAGIDLLHIPYKGGGEAVTSVLAGTTDSYFSAPIESGEHVKAGKLTLLGASSLKRTPGLPDVPTLAESGLPGFEVTHYTSVLVKAGTPPDIIAKLSENIVRAIQTPEVRDKVAQNGDVPLGTLAEATALYANEYQRWSRAVKAADIKP